MLSVEKIENTLQIGKSHGEMFTLRQCESSKGLSSGHLEVFKTESELCLRPGSPERYKSTLNIEEITPPTKISFQHDLSSQCSFQDITNFQKMSQTPAKDSSISLEFEAEDVPDIGNSFFSSANEARELSLFETGKENEEKMYTFNSFASTNSKTDKLHEEIMVFHKGLKRTYKNNCKIQCTKCNLVIVTDLKIAYPSSSM